MARRFDHVARDVVQLDARDSRSDRGTRALVGLDDHRVQLRDLLERLGSRGMLGVLCEGGPTLASALLREHLVDELQLLVAPVVLGAQAAPAFHGLDGTLRAKVDRVERLGDDTLIVTTFEQR